MIHAIHPASEQELYNLTSFVGSDISIEQALGNPTDIAANWMILGIEEIPTSDHKRVIVLERSTSAIAYIIGDGEYFGQVDAPTESETQDIIKRYIQ